MAQSAAALAGVGGICVRIGDMSPLSQPCISLVGSNQLFFDVFGNAIEAVLDISIFFGTCFKKRDSIRFCQLLPLFVGHGPIRHVALVSNKNLRYVLLVD